MENAPGASQTKMCIASCNTLRDYYLCCMSVSMTLLQKYHKLNRLDYQSYSISQLRIPIQALMLPPLFCVIKAVTDGILLKHSAVANLPLPQRLKLLSRLVKPECYIRNKSKHLR